jgi:hypothetical protein
MKVGNLSRQCQAVVLASAFAAACSGKNPPTDKTGLLDPPGGDAPGIALAPAGSPVPLTWLLTIDSTETLDVDATFDDGVHPVEITSKWTGTPIHVNGLRPSTTYDVSVVLTDPEGHKSTALGGPITNSPLPADFPDIKINVADSARMEAGYTMLLIRPYLTDNSKAYLVALDDEGQVAWYLEPTVPALVATRFPDDTLVTVQGNPGPAGGPIQQLTLEGGPLQSWHSADNLGAPGIACAAAGFEHDVAPNPTNGHWVSLFLRELEEANYPTSYSQPGHSFADVATDVVFEFDPKDPDCNPGTEIALDTLLDRQRIGYNSLDPTNPDGPYDWGHANAVWVDPDDGGYVVSLRNQDAIVKVRDGKLVWILGNHDNWHPQWQQYLLAPQGDLEWQYHQHSPQVSPYDHNRIIVMDNGDGRASPLTGEPVLADDQKYTRVVEFQVDEDAMTVEQTWELRTVDGGSIFSEFVGDADYLTGTGHILATFGYVIGMGGVSNADRGLGTHSVRILEVDYDDPTDVVFDVELSSPPDLDGWTAYRSQRVASLYAAGDVTQAVIK